MLTQCLSSWVSDALQSHVTFTFKGLVMGFRSFFLAACNCLIENEPGVLHARDGKLKLSPRDCVSYSVSLAI